MSENGNIQQKDVDKTAIRRSVRETPTTEMTPNDANAFTLFVASFADDITPWGKNVARRDKELRDFWPTEPMLASAVNAVVQARANMSWQLDGPPRTVNKVQRMLQASNMGKGWLSLRTQVAIDLLTQDNGAFVELVRMRKSPAAPVINLAHLDAGRCRRTGIPEFPVIYMDIHGKEHKMPWYTVMTFEEMPSPVETMNGVQYSFLTRVLRAAQVIRDIGIYKREKISGRNPGEIHLVSGVQHKLIEDTLRDQAETADNQGYTRFQLPAVLGSLDPNATVSTATVSLRNVPDGFDEDTSLKWYIAQLALGAGADYQDFAPLPGGNLGTSQQSEILHRKSRGKGHETSRKLWEHKLNFHGVLPRSVTFRFDEQDTAADMEQVEVDEKKASIFSTYIKDGVLPANVVHQMMADEGILKPEYLALLQHEDVTEDVTATDEAPAVTEAELDEAANVTPEEVPLEVRSKAHKDDVSYGWVGLRMPEKIRRAAMRIAWLISPDDLHEIGVEDDLHVTVKYGFEDSVTADDVTPAVSGLLPAVLQFGKLSLFENDEFDVLKVEVESDTLREMNARLSALPNADEHPEYNPYMTIAYLLPGAGQQYTGLNVVVGKTATIDTAVFSDKDENETVIRRVRRKQFEDDLSDYEDELAELTERLQSGEITQSEFEALVEELVSDSVLLSFLEGSGKDEGDLTDADLATIQEMQQPQLDAVPNLAIDVAEGKFTGDEPNDLGARVTLWGGQLASAYIMGKLRRPDNPNYVWLLGATEQHCSDCLRLSGQVHTAAEWEDSGWRPRITRLECNGYRCDCDLAETNEPTRGTY